MIQKKKDTIKSLAIHDKDVGSTEIQIGLLTTKIAKLSVHFKNAKKDKHSSVGLLRAVNISNQLPALKQDGSLPLRLQIKASGYHPTRSRCCMKSGAPRANNGHL